jgi:hypothetical protein
MSPAAGAEWRRATVVQSTRTGSCFSRRIKVSGHAFRQDLTPPKLLSLTSPGELALIFPPFQSSLLGDAMALCESCEASVSGFPGACANCGSSLGTSSPAMSQTVSEQVVLDQSGVFISNCRVISAGQTHAMSGVTSFRRLVESPSKAGPVIAMLAGACMVIISRFGVYLPRGTSDPLLWVGIGLFVLGLLVLLTTKSIHSVVIHCASGEVKSLPSKDEALIQKILDALNQAVVIRG